MSSINFVGDGVSVNQGALGEINVNILGTTSSVDSVSAGTGIGVNQTTGDIIISNTGVTGLTISPSISDEKGFTTDLGLRGNYINIVSYDVGVFGLFYKNRIGFIQKAFPDGSIKTVRGNVGDAVMYGLESLIDFNLNKLFIKDNDYSFNYFINTSIIDSKYTVSEENGVEGKKVEFVPNLNLY